VHRCINERHDDGELKLARNTLFWREFIIVEKLRGTVNRRKAGDMGIDGWTELMQVAVQAKRWGHKVGRPELDKFKTSLERDRKTRGMIIAFDFSKDSYNEVARIKNEGIDIELKTVKEIIEETV